jgi:aldose 1-epimerase
MPFETIVTGEPGHPAITLTELGTGCQAEIYSFGGLLNAFRIPQSQGLTNVIDGFSSVKEAMENATNGFKSAKLSPFVCRIKSGQYRFENRDYTIQKHLLSGHAIHGLLYDAAFKITDTTSEIDHASVTMAYDYNGTDKGYPFPYKITVKWKLEAANKLSVTTTLTHHNKTDIPIADGWHPYFTLGGSVDDCTLQFDSDCQLEYDAELLPTGKKITDTRFTNGTPLRGIELDNSFELNTNIAAKCVLENDRFRLTIEPGKEYPLVQVYIPSHRNSIAIENLSGAPDNFNNGMGLILLAPGEEKAFTTSYWATAKF